MLHTALRRCCAPLLGTLFLGGLLAAPGVAAALPGWQWLSPNPTGFPINYSSFPTASEGFVVGDRGTVLHSSDSGTTFLQQDSGTGVDLLGVNFLGDALTGWVVGDLGTILHTTDGGKHWAKQNSSTTRKLKAVLFLDAQHGFAVGEFRTLLETADGGQTWTGHSGQILTLNAIAFPDATHGFVVGWGGGVLRTVDGGANWSLVTTPTAANLLAVSFFDVNHGFAVGTGGEIIRTDDGGLSWQLAGGGSFGTAGPPDGGSPDAGPVTDLDIFGVAATSATAAYAIASGVGSFGFESAVTLTTTDGFTWTTPLQYFGSTSWNSMTVSPDGSVWATSSSGLLYHATSAYAPFPYFMDTNSAGFYDNDAGVYNYFGLYNDVPALAFVDPLEGIFAGGYFALYSTNNGGDTFTYGNMLDADGGYGYFNYPDGGATPNGAPQVYWQAVSMPSPGVAYAAGTGGSIAVSTDKGLIWHFVSGAADFPQNVDFFGIQMVDALNGYACGSNGMLFQTSDGWAHFTTQSIAAGKLRAIHMRDTAFGIVVGDFGQILRTQNGNSWFPSQVPSTAFGDLYGLSVVSPVLAYAVGKAGLMLVSFDDGQTWTQSAPPTLHDLTQVFFTSPNDGYLTTSEGEILTTRDGTLTWEQQFGFGSVSLLSLDFPDATHGFAGGTLGTLLGTVTAGQPTCQTNADCRVDAGAVSYLCDVDAGGVCTACNTNQNCGPACSPCPTSTPFCWGGFCGECHTASDCTVNGPGTWACRFGTCLNLNPPDAGNPDAGITDAGPADAGFDAGPPPVDAGGDAGPVDAGCQAPDGAPMSCELPQSSGCGCSPSPGRPDAGLLLLFSLFALFFLPLRTARR